jgi:hypothetical protein
MPHPAVRARSVQSIPNERRATIRHPATLLGSLHPVAPKGAPCWDAAIRDVSAGGIALLVSQRFEPGTLLAVEPESPPEGAPTFLLVQVVRVVAQPDGVSLLGAKLIRELCESEVAALR